jgi:hypothetical protein
VAGPLGALPGAGSGPFAALLGAGQAPLGAVLEPVAAALLGPGVVGPQADRGGAQVAVEEHPLPRPQPPQVLDRQQRPVAHTLVHTVAAVRPHRAGPLHRLPVADQLGPEFQGGEVGQAGQEQLGPVVVEDRGRLGPVAGLQLAVVVPDGDQLDPLPPRGGGQHVQLAQGGAVARLVQEQPQPGGEHAVW